MTMKPTVGLFLSCLFFFVKVYWHACQGIMAVKKCSREETFSVWKIFLTRHKVLGVKIKLCSKSRALAKNADAMKLFKENAECLCQKCKYSSKYLIIYLKLSRLFNHMKNDTLSESVLSFRALQVFQKLWNEVFLKTFSRVHFSQKLMGLLFIWRGFK